MTFSPLDIKSESDLFQHLQRVAGSFFNFERVEPANESGFPDLHFNTRRDFPPPIEGTIELKFFKSSERPNLSGAKFRGNQKAALIEYHAAGGNRRFVMAYHSGALYVWDTKNAVRAIMGKTCGLRVYGLGDLDESNSEEVTAFCKWLAEVLA